MCRLGISQIVVLLLSVVAVGCMSKVSTPSEFARSAEYQQRDQIEASLFESDTALMGDADILRALEGRVQLPARARLAVLLASGNSLGIFDSIDEASVVEIIEALNRIEPLNYVSYMPSLLVPDKVTVPHLREAAARYQADLLLVCRVGDRSYSNYRTFGRDEASAHGFAECILIDVRTGIVPFAGSATEQVRVAENRDDVSFYETRSDAVREASGVAVLQLVGELAAYLNGLPSV